MHACSIAMPACLPTNELRTFVLLVTARSFSPLLAHVWRNALGAASYSMRCAAVVRGLRCQIRLQPWQEGACSSA